jgi:steroid delta-isomerase-like uncharacterized protein
MLLLSLWPDGRGAWAQDVRVIETNKAIVRHLFEVVWNEAQLDAIERKWAADVVFHIRGRANAVGPDRLKQQVLSWRKAFPDFRFIVEDIIGEGDRVAIRVRFTGTHTGADWFGLSPTGKQIDVTEMMFFRIQDGKVLEAWEDYDELTMRRQLGARP